VVKSGGYMLKHNFNALEKATQAQPLQVLMNAALVGCLLWRAASRPQVPHQPVVHTHWVNNVEMELSQFVGCSCTAAVRRPVRCALCCAAQQQLNGACPWVAAGAAAAAVITI
jgi:hypothetical protein